MSEHRNLILRVHGILMEVTKHAVRLDIGKVLRKAVELELLLNCLSGSRRGSQSI